MASDSIEKLTSRLRREHGWGDFVTFDLTLKRWKWLVREVERGYDDIIEEYCNDLDSRDILQMVMDAASPEDRAEIENRLRKLDERFRAATEPVDPPLWSGGWWGERRPRKLVGELREDLEEGR